MNIQRFTAYRRNLSELGTHTPAQRNADNEPQYEGVIWSDGTVTLRWLTACKSTSVWTSIQECLDVHGHPEYGTEIIWHDGPAPGCWSEALGRYHTLKKYKELTEMAKSVDLWIGPIGSNKFIK